MNGNRGAQQEIRFNKSFKKNCTISTGILNLGVSCKKWSNCTSGVRQKIRLRLHPKTSDSATLILMVRKGYI